MINEYGAVDGMRIGRGNRKPDPEPLFPPQLSHILNWDGIPEAGD
jgi:hypothetical protein